MEKTSVDAFARGETLASIAGLVKSVAKVVHLGLAAAVNKNSAIASSHVKLPPHVFAKKGDAAGKVAAKHKEKETVLSLSVVREDAEHPNGQPR